MNPKERYYSGVARETRKLDFFSGNDGSKL